MLGHDDVGDPEAREVPRGAALRGGQLGGVAGRAVEDGRGGLGAIASSDACSAQTTRSAASSASAPPLPPSPASTASVGTGVASSALRHSAIAHDSPALLGRPAQLGPWRVDDSEHRQAELSRDGDGARRALR